MTEADRIVRKAREDNEKREIIKRIKIKLMKMAEKKAEKYIKDYEDNIDKIPLDKFKECEEGIDDYLDLSS